MSSWGQKVIAAKLYVLATTRSNPIRVNRRLGTEKADRICMGHAGQSCRDAMEVLFPELMRHDARYGAPSLVPTFVRIDFLPLGL